jgi:hypothetical protein
MWPDVINWVIAADSGLFSPNGRQKYRFYDKQTSLCLVLTSSDLQLSNDFPNWKGFMMRLILLSGRIAGRILSEKEALWLCQVGSRQNIWRHEEICWFQMN